MAVANTDREMGSWKRSFHTDTVLNMMLLKVVKIYIFWTAPPQIPQLVWPVELALFEATYPRGKSIQYIKSAHRQPPVGSYQDMAAVGVLMELEKERQGHPRRCGPMPWAGLAWKDWSSR
ncbi:hypothetical protein JRQ81_003867 [Phrynocephalus forsythii]|uniref:Uncharacterized protein n=1 Tax=Phrynocephalus forsythii TaxID=171643 RepID=A0A9Q0XLP3_9SAUR|nr:hypothetical protein JRQ81_003867 [Phrynocephalus forsythii]